jgi:hypothetical protein
MRGKELSSYKKKIKIIEKKFLKSMCLSYP